MSGFTNPTEYIQKAFENIGSSGNSGFSFGLLELLGDINNLNEILQANNRGWVGSDPMFSHLFIYQPPLYKGRYLPRNLVKSVKIPERNLKTQSFKFKGGDITYATGFDVSDFSVTFYENQEMQVLGYLRTWQSDIVSAGGAYYGLPNDYKYTMFFIYNNSLGNPTNNLTTNLLNYIPGAAEAFNKINFCGIVILNGCFPEKISYDKHENLDSHAYEVTATFNVDEMIQLPLNLDADTIFTLLDLGSGLKDLAGKSASDLASQASSLF